MIGEVREGLDNSLTYASKINLEESDRFMGIKKELIKKLIVL